MGSRQIQEAKITISWGKRAGRQRGLGSFWVGRLDGRQLFGDMSCLLSNLVFLNFLGRWVNHECDTAAVVSASETRSVMLREVFHQPRKLREGTSESTTVTWEFSGWRPLERAQGGGLLSLIGEPQAGL